MVFLLFVKIHIDKKCVLLLIFMYETNYTEVSKKELSELENSCYVRRKLIGC